MPPERVVADMLRHGLLVVQSMVAADRSLLTIHEYRREISVILSLDTENLQPDGSMQLRTPADIPSPIRDTS